MGREKSNYWKMHSRYRADAGDIDLFFIRRPGHTSGGGRYTDLTGKSVMLPRTALGYLGSSMYYRNCRKIVTTRFLSLLIPQRGGYTGRWIPALLRLYLTGDGGGLETVRIYLE